MEILMFTIFVFPSALLLLASAACLYVFVSVYAGKSINSPDYAPVNGTVFHQLLYFTKLYDHQTEQARKQSTFRLLTPDCSELYTTDPRNIEHILKTKFDVYTKGKGNQDLLSDLFGQGIFAVDGQKWKHQRKLASFEFSTRILRDFSCAVFRKNAAKLALVVSELATNDRVFDMQELLMRSTLESMFKVGFGVALNCFDGSSREGTSFMNAFDEANALTYWRYVDPFWKLKRFLNLGCEASLRKNINILDDFVGNLIATKRRLLTQQQSSHHDKDDILSRFLVESQREPEKMNDGYLRDIILNFMIAGKDSSANTLSWLFYLLSKNPLIQERVVQEVMEATGSGAHPPHYNGIEIEEFAESITEETLEKLHYLHAAISETLRLYPAIPIDGRCAEVDDVLPDGFKVKKGDGVYYMAYAMGRMPYIWGDDAEEFKPERWLKNGIFQPESPFKFIAFHGGPRICLGKDFAYRQMKIVSTVLLRLFRFKLGDEMKPVTYRTMFTLQVKDGLYLKAIPRAKILLQ